jgi:polyadenylate-binding protein
LFVSNLPENFTTDKLRAIFAEFGEIKSCEVSSKNSTQGFINFASHEFALKAIETISMKKNIEGKTLMVQQHVYKKESEIKGSSNQIAENMSNTYKSNIFVKYVPKATTLDQLKDIFGKCGTILSAKLEDHFIYV